MNVNANDGAKIEKVKIPQPEEFQWLPYLLIFLPILLFIGICIGICVYRRKRRRFKTREADTIAYGPAHK